MKMSLKKGMTLVEVMIAVAILATSSLALAAFMAKFAKAISVSDVKNTAVELASQRIEEIKNAPRYAAIDSMYTGVVSMGAPYTGFTRQTLVSHFGGGASDLYDYRTITVVVNNTRLSAPIKRTTIIAAF